MSSLTPYLPFLAVATMAAVTLYVSRLRRALHGLEVAFLVLILSLPLLTLGVYRLLTYGWGVFVGIPLLNGFVSVLLYCRNAPGRPWRECRNVAMGSTLTVGAAALLAGIEGLLCLAMAFPLAISLCLLGAAIAHSLQARLWKQRASPALLLLLLLSAPLLMGAEAAVSRRPPVYQVRTAVEIDAPPSAVWKNVVSFDRLPPPDDWLLQTGLAYPVHARIQGRGAGAVRYCEFSTGAFVEPIEIWDEPRRLAFRVTSSPPALVETSPYGRIHPPHVQGFLVSRHGQFLLTPLPGGRTRLEGTTWYQHGLYPAGYWRLWSDWIIHRIHRQVLLHVKRLSEERTRRLAL